MNFFNLAKKNKALDDARKLLKEAQYGQLKAQQDLDWAESMRIYHQLREKSLREFIARVEQIEATEAPVVTNETSIPVSATSIKAVVGNAVAAFKAPKRERRPQGGLAEA